MYVRGNVLQGKLTGSGVDLNTSICGLLLCCDMVTTTGLIDSY